MTRQEYIDRYVAQMLARADVDEAFARESAEESLAWPSEAERLEAGTPEEDAETEMSYWDE